MKLSGLSAIALLTILTACSDSSTSRTQDIFLEDQGAGEAGNARRHPASDTEKLWTILMPGCTGHLIAPNLMMTANHCTPAAGERYTSGYALTQGRKNDITAAQLVESSSVHDYAILKITWDGGSAPRQQKFPPLIATSPTDVEVSRGEGGGDALYTVGFPGDKRGTWGATYSEGHAKAVQSGRLVYNIGIINGNSGGGVWRKRDNMLVSLTNGGPNNLGQGDWNSASSTNANNWNFGAAMWEAYADSATLKDVFPGGRNRYATSAPDLFIAFGQADNAAADSFWLHASVPDAATKVIFCATAKPADCRDGANGYTLTSEAPRVGGRKHFRGNVATALQNGMILSYVALDSGGQTVAAQGYQVANR